jgi:hypothetical protein
MSSRFGPGNMRHELSLLVMRTIRHLTIGCQLRGPFKEATLRRQTLDPDALRPKP